MIASKFLFFAVVPFCVALLLPSRAKGEEPAYPHNANRCEHCHALPSKFGSSPLTVKRVGVQVNGRFVPGAEGGIEHRFGTKLLSALASAQDYAPMPEGAAPGNEVKGDRITLSLMGDGYIEAIDGHAIEQNAERQQQSKTGIAGSIVRAPVLEAGSTTAVTVVGRFGWKSQHGSLMSACADSLRNELGIRNRLYPAEYSTHDIRDGVTPKEMPDGKTGQTGLDRLVEDVRQTLPPARDPKLAASTAAHEGERIFSRIGCQVCHVSTYRTLPTGAPINGGMYVIPPSAGNAVIHPYSDFLLHDIGTGDGIVQAAIPEYLDQSTAMKFRTPPLWGLRFRSWLMHDGKSTTTAEAIARHAGEAGQVRKRYERLSARQKKCLQSFLNSL